MIRVTSVQWCVLNVNSIFKGYVKYFKLVEDDQISTMYWMAEQKCRQITKYMSYNIFINQSVDILPLFQSIYCIWTGNLDTSTWELPFNVVVPFNTQHLFGWYLKWFINLAMTISYALIVTAIISYFVCCCLYIHAICKHFNLLNNFIEQNDKSIHKNLTKAIDVHAKVFE